MQKGIRRAHFLAAIACLALAIHSLTPAFATHTQCDDEGLGDDVFVDASGAALVGADTGLNDGWNRACVDVLGTGVTVASRRQGTQEHGFLLSCTAHLTPWPGTGTSTCGGPQITDGFAIGAGGGLDDNDTPFALGAVFPTADLNATINYSDQCDVAGEFSSTGFYSGVATATGLGAVRNLIQTTATLTTGYELLRVGLVGVMLTGTGGVPTKVTFANGLPNATRAQNLGFDGVGVALVLPVLTTCQSGGMTVQIIALASPN